MSLWTRSVDVAFDVFEGVVSLYDFVRRFRQPEPIPLTRRSVAHQQEQIRRATIRPPPP